MTAPEQFKCTKCGGRMIKGFIVDFSNNSYFPNHWVEGEPERSKLLGVTGINLDISNKQKYTVKALRCEKCGFLESYAV